jgi:hypothetical protein
MHCSLQQKSTSVSSWVHFVQWCATTFATVCWALMVYLLDYSTLGFSLIRWRMCLAQGSGAVQSPSIRGAVGQLSLVLGILVAFALANLAAPSSAVTMILRLDWWPLKELEPVPQITFSAFVQASNATPFPEKATNEFLWLLPWGQCNITK